MISILTVTNRPKFIDWASWNVSKQTYQDIEWIVINYAEENNVFYIIRSGGVKRPFYVYTEYKNELNGYSKKYFDPFCRKRKIIYSYKVPGKPTITFISSIAQLNFFKWAIENKIVDYVIDHFDAIFKDMNIANKKQRDHIVMPVA